MPLRKALFKKREKGATLVLFTFLSIFVVLPFIGLAIDGAVFYLMKAKLTSAVDATALATVRSLSVGQTLTQQTAAATSTGQAYFSANLPAGTFGAIIPASQPAISIGTQSNTLTANVQASIQVPLYFMRLLGIPSATVTGGGTATRKIANVILVLDRSGSLEQSGSCPTLISSSINFTNYFVEGRDTVGLITFQNTANVDFAATTAFKSSSPNLTSTLSQLVCSGGTNTVEGLNLAYHQITDVIKQPLALNAIVLFTDGWADSFPATFTSQPPLPALSQIKNLADKRYDWYNTATIDSLPASGCRANLAPATPDVLTGVLLAPSGSPDPTGFTAGLFQDIREQISYAGVAGGFPRQTISSQGSCSFNNPNPYGYPYDALFFRNDIAYLPSTDIYGNLLTGHWALDYFPLSNGPYAGLPRPDTPLGVMNAAQNAADNQAKTIRSDTAYNPVIYTIGLGPSVNTDLLQRIANDSASSSYNSGQQQGKYYPATTSGLNAVFQQVASQILRLSK